MANYKTKKRIMLIKFFVWYKEMIGKLLLYYIILYFNNYVFINILKYYYINIILLKNLIN